MRSRPTSGGGATMGSGPINWQPGGDGGMHASSWRASLACVPRCENTLRWDGLPIAAIVGLWNIALELDELGMVHVPAEGSFHRFRICFVPVRGDLHPVVSRLRRSSMSTMADCLGALWAWLNSLPGRRQATAL